MKFTRLQLIVICISAACVLAGFFRIVIPGAPTPVTDAPIIELTEEGPEFSYQLIEKPELTELIGTEFSADVETAGMININAAGPALMQKLPRVGSKTARAIIDYRIHLGGFTHLRQLKEIRGIGDKTLKKIETMAYCGPMGEFFEPEPTPEEPADKPSQKQPTPPPEIPVGERININTAGTDELITLPRIGPATAGKIIADRESNGPYKTVDDLTRVSGIGKKTLENLRPLITVE